MTTGFSRRLASFRRFSTVSLLVFLLLARPVDATLTLDPTFGGGGKLTIAFPDSSNGYSSRGQRIFVQPSGRIIAAGSFTHASADGQIPGVAFVGLTPGGAVDSTYAMGGLILAWEAFGATSLNDALMYPDGRTLRVSRFFTVTGSSTIRAVRLGADGAVDNVFASNVSIGPSGGFGTARPSQVAVRTDEKILALILDGGQFQLYRLNADGSRDTTFGVNGIVQINFNKISTPPDFNMEMVVLNDGRVIIVGHVPPFVSPNGSSEFFLARLTASGNWDKTFGRAGYVRFAFGPGRVGRVDDAILQPDGKLLLAGSVFESDVDTWLMRIKPNGRPDNSFGSNGVVVNDLAPGGTDSVSAVALAADGTIRISGSIGSPVNFLVARCSSSGSLEDSISIPFTPNQYAQANALAFQPDGKIVVIGETRNPDLMATTGSVFAIARLTE